MALVYLRELDNNVRFAIWRIEEPAEDLIGRLQLGAREKAVLSRLNKGKRTLHWLATRVLLRKMLDTPGYIDCPSDENGKPYLANFPQRISLTHSFDYAAVMMSDNGEVGIDLELVKPKILRIADKFMKPNELEAIGRTGIEKLYACWCAKEAVYKLQGNKGVSFKDNMTIRPFDFQDQGVLFLDLDAPHRQERFKVYYEKFQEYMLGYVTEN
ncbi:4'-phosphopantetheinyl transferase superfamily protein [Parapedobacter sp. ISTM3]|uniref:4'-phosphopantetheinyl transferase superfamily protein n=1 Tax=Parapedobacter luteus TaxID=623280 RepID=A0A1T5A225_9SPHI|nr:MULTISPECIES: 4'-phosphopantetheinyl transferase superfamily protein [Parapedobacter]MBK1440068.1 4'-phosphopantetheinyl transferase superfamily protein [Parapedobacter sp. ISTM3]SKB29000.1 4'-phosphopantetheinyl transferase superfamily protein [Parapedobacter luteus]